MPAFSSSIVDGQICCSTLITPGCEEKSLNLRLLEIVQSFFTGRDRDTEKLLSWGRTPRDVVVGL